MKKNKQDQYKILITGSSGFIGKNLIDKLKNYQILYDSKNKKHFNLYLTSLIKKQTKVDVVIHTAGKTPYSNFLTYKDFFENNLFSTLHVLDFCVKNKVKKLIFLSSYVYGISTKKKVNENHKIKPNTPYSMSKYLSEQLCEFYHRFYGLNIIILRPFNIYGKYQKKGFFISNVINSLNTDKPILVKNRKSKRDFLYVDDLTKLILKLIKLDFDFDIFNVGSGRSYSFEEIIKMIEKISRKSINVIYEEDSSSLIPDIVCDISKIKKKVGWKPKIQLNKGLSNILKI